MAAEASDKQGETAEPVSSNIGASPGGKKRFDPGFTRNIKILVAALIGAIIVTGFLIMRSKASSRETDNRAAAAATQIAVQTNKNMEVGTKEAVVTQPDIDRITRVGQQQSQEAAKTGETFIPKNMPLTNAPEIVGNGPGSGYNMQTGRGGGGDAAAKREQVREAGMKVQLDSILKGLEAPETSSAGAPYNRNAEKSAGQTSVAAATGAAPSTPGPEASDMVPGLSIHGAVLTSPLDTAKTDYISARIVSGPAKGGILFGKGQVVGDEGVRIIFNRLALKDVAYTVNVVALDTQTSSNAMSADIDRKLFSRYVIPIFGAMGKAYADAVARPQQQVVVGTNSVNIATPEASARQAAAAGVAAGLGKVTEAATYNGPNTAFMPEGAAIGVLFMDAVKATKGRG